MGGMKAYNLCPKWRTSASSAGYTSAPASVSRRLGLREGGMCRTKNRTYYRTLALHIW